MKIASFVYDSGKGAEVDIILASIAASLHAAGLKLGGAIQINSDDGNRCSCDMSLQDLATGRQVLISENRGPLASGCRLDPRGLEEVVGLVEASIARGIDVLIVNKFGKRESEGKGFRDAIEAALAHGAPVLVAVSGASLDAWDAFVEGLDERLAFDAEAAIDWVLQALGHATSEPAFAVGHAGLPTEA